MNRVADIAELYLWQQVPHDVSRLVKEARPVQQTVKAILKHLGAGERGNVFWHPERRELHAVLDESSSEATHNRWYNALKAVKGVSRVVVDTSQPPKVREWVLIKRANPLGLYGGLQNLFGKITDGPSPLTNMLASGLLTSGLGYGTGWLLERLFPEKYVQRGRLSKNLAMAGGALGVIPGLWQWGVNANNSPQGGLFNSLVTPNKDVRYYPRVGAEMDAYYGGFAEPPDLAGNPTPATGLNKASQELAHQPARGTVLDNAITQFTKAAFVAGDLSGAGGLRAVPVDAFNNAIWNDVRRGMTPASNPYGTKNPWGDNSQSMHTPPHVGAAASALVTGVSDMYGNQSVLSPRHFVRGLAAAGADMVTARVVGGVLGALGGLTPEAQDKLQQMGLWGGLMRGTVGSLLR